MTDKIISFCKSWAAIVMVYVFSSHSILPKSAVRVVHHTDVLTDLQNNTRAIFRRRRSATYGLFKTPCSEPKQIPEARSYGACAMCIHNYLTSREKSFMVHMDHRYAIY